MKRSVLLSLTGITFLTLLLLSAAHSSPELREMPQRGGAYPHISTDDADSAALFPPDDSIGAERGSIYNGTYYERFNDQQDMDAANTDASWAIGRLTLAGSRPAVRGTVALSETPTNVAAAWNYAYVTTASGFRVIDISDPDAPIPVGIYVLQGNTANHALAIALSGDAAYVAAAGNGLEVVDISNPLQPRYVRSYARDFNVPVQAVAARGDRLYVADNGALCVLSIADPFAPSLLGAVAVPGVRDIDIDAGLAITAGGNQLATIDISRADAPLLLDTHSLPSVRRVAMHGNSAWVGVPWAFGSVDVSLASQIRQIASVSACDGFDVLVEDRVSHRVYFADSECGIRMMNVEDARHLYTYGWTDLDTRVRYLALTPTRLVAAGVDPDQLVVLDRINGPIEADTAVATSGVVYAHHRQFIGAQVETDQTGDIEWEVSADGGVHWDAANRDGLWTRFRHPGTELRWRATLRMRDGIVPSCTRLTIRFKQEPLPPEGGAVIRVRRDGTGDVRNLYAARDIWTSGDTLLVGDGVYTGNENRGLYFEGSVTIRSENGPERTIIDCEGLGPFLVRARGRDTDFHRVRIEGLQIRNAYSSSTGGAIYTDRCFLDVVDCEFVGGGENIIWTDLSFANVSNCRFIDCENAIVSHFNVDVSDCLFSGLRYGVWLADGGMHVTRSTFFDNTYAITVRSDGNATIEDNTISYNDYGVWMDWASGNIRDNVFDGNATAIRLEESQAIPVSGNLIVRNTRVALSIEGSNAQIIGNTICDNEVRQDALIDLRDFSDVTAHHNVFAFNRGDIFSAFERTRARAGENLFWQNDGDELLAVFDEGGHLFEDPLFCGREDGDYTVSSYSPCLAGNNALGVRIGARGMGCSGDPSDQTVTIRDGLIYVAPNPFNPSTRIHYGQSTPGEVRLDIYDVAGRLVDRLVQGDLVAGERDIEWNASAVSSGVYFARLTTPDGAFTKKLVVVK